MGLVSKFFRTQWKKDPENNFKNDKELVRACLRGNTFAQETLYRRFAPLLFGICLRYSSSTEEAEDLLHDLFLHIYTRLDKWKGKGSLSGWLRKVAVNFCLRWLQRHGRLKIDSFPKDEEGAEIDLPAEEPDIISELSAKELIEAIQKLPDGYRTVFNLYIVEGYSHKEIAEMLGISVNTSKSQLSRAKALLRKMLLKEKITRNV